MRLRPFSRVMKSVVRLDFCASKDAGPRNTVPSKPFVSLRIWVVVPGQEVIVSRIVWTRGESVTAKSAVQLISISAIESSAEPGSGKFAGARVAVWVSGAVARRRLGARELDKF